MSNISAQSTTRLVKAKSASLGSVFPDGGNDHVS